MMKKKKRRAEMERLDKLLSSTGRWSRKEVKELVRQGRVLVDGVLVLRPEEKVEPSVAALTVDGQTVDCAPFVYVMLHKPAGLLSATEDSRQPTVLDVLPPELKKRGLFPVVSSPMTAIWHTGCSPPESTWTRCTARRWTAK